MRSVWLCSANDVMANMTVLVADALVAWVGEEWLDINISAIMARLFLNWFRYHKKALNDCHLAHEAMRQGITTE